MEHTATFEVRIEGVKGGKPLVPADYDIKELRALLEEVEVWLFPNNRHQRPVLPQVFPANQTLRSNTNSRGDLWERYDASFPASP